MLSDREQAQNGTDRDISALRAKGLDLLAAQLKRAWRFHKNRVVRNAVARTLKAQHPRKERVT